MKSLLFFSCLFFFLFASSASATWIWGSNSTGGQKNVFFTNESIYVTSGNISNATTNVLSVRIYVVNNSNSWSNNTALTDVTGGYTVVSTNSSGYIASTLVWDSPKAGDYDIIADVNLDGNYTSNIDYVDNLTATGIQVIAIPVPILAVSKAPGSPSDHTWSVGNASNNAMLQLKLTASNENVRVDTVWIDANGTGDDKNGISLVRLVLDQNNNSIYDTGETLLSYGKYASDDGLLALSILNGNGYTISTGSTVYMLLLYTISSSASSGETFSFQALTISATGIDSSKQATVSGLPINSAVKKMVSGVPPALCPDYMNETSCSGAVCQWCNITSVCKNATETCPTCTGSLNFSLERHGNTSTAQISGLSSCGGEKAYLRQGSCTGSTVGNCSISGSGCWVSFSTPTSFGNYTYFACVDMNANGEFSSQERKSSVLEVSPPEETPPFFIDWGTIVLIVAVAVLIVGIAFAIFWFTRAKHSKPYTFKFEPSY